MFVCLFVCLYVYISVHLSVLVCHFLFIYWGEKNDWTLLRSIHMLKYSRLSNHCSSTCLSMQRHQIVWTVYSRTFPRKEIYTVYFLMGTHAVYAYFQGPERAFVSTFFFFFFLRVPPNIVPSEQTSFFHLLRSLFWRRKMRPN